MTEREPPKEAGPGGESMLTEAFVETILRAGQKNLAEDGQLLPVLFLHLASGEKLASILRLPDTPEEKQAYLAGIRAYLRQAGLSIQEAVFMAEAWYVEVEEGEGSLEVAPSQHPARREVIAIVGRDAAGRRLISVVQPFSRDPQHRPVFEPAEMTQTDVPPDSEPPSVGLIDHLFAEVPGESGAEDGVEPES